jgi:ATP-binding cassette subfamily B (MDR/TAP) protein 1
VVREKAVGNLILLQALPNSVQGILAVLQRFYDITGGSILLDGVDIRQLEVRALRSQMGYVSQEPLLFEGTVRWNLLVSVHPFLAYQAELDRLVRWIPQL